MLAFWTGKDPARIVELFRKSGLMREKAERDDYVWSMACKAIASVSDVYGATRATAFGPQVVGPGAETSPWPPPLDEAAFHGPVGDLVRASPRGCRQSSGMPSGSVATTDDGRRQTASWSPQLRNGLIWL